MQFSLATILAASSVLLSGVAAVPSASAADMLVEQQDCTISASTVKTWHENAMSRRRVAFSTSKGGVSDDEMKRLGRRWDDGKEKCTAVTNNMRVYYHKGIGSWVVDSSDVLGAGGDSVHDCVLGRSKDRLSRELGCSV